jgi:MFS family permease
MELGLAPKLNEPMQQSSLWRNRNFLFLWIGTIISNIGMQMYIIALPLLIYDLTNSALAMSTMRAIEFFPNILIGMLAGVLVDRSNRKNILSFMSLIQIIALGVVILFLWTEEILVWHLYIFGFILSSAGYTFGNAQHAVIPTLVHKKQLTDVNAKISFTNTMINLIGPGLAGLLLALFSYKVSFTFYLICLICLFILVRFLKIPTLETPKKYTDKSIWKDMKEGLDELFKNKTLLTPTLTILLTNFSSSLLIGVLMFYATDHLGLKEKQIGIMYSLGAIGGLVGSLVINKLRKKFGRGNVYVYCMLIDLCGIIVLIFSYSWWMVGISLFIRSLGVTMTNIIYFSIRQEFTPNHLLGRVAGTSSMIMKLVVPLGLFVAGIWAEFLPIKGLFFISAAMIIAIFIKLVRNPIKRVV